MILIIAVLSFVVAISLTVLPKRHVGHWKQLADKFKTYRQPNRITFPSERLFVGDLSIGMWRLPWRRSFWRFDDGEYALFDVECDGEGLWLLHKGENLAKCADAMLVPWSDLSLRLQHSNEIVLSISTDYLIDIRMPMKLGAVCLERLCARD